MDRKEMVKVTKENQVATLTIDFPPANTLNSKVYLALEEQLQQLLSDGDIRAVVLTGAGDRVFVGGADVGELATFDRQQLAEYIQLNRRVFRLIEEAPFPVICALNGHAFGGGCELAMVCDIRVAHAKVRIGQPEVTVGVIPGAGGTQRLPRFIPQGKALWMLLTGQWIDAKTAEAMGLVDFVVENDVLSEARQIAAKIAQQAPLAVAAIKKAVRLGVERPLVNALELEAQLSLEVSDTEDAKEGYQAFREKRPAIFRGR